MSSKVPPERRPAHGALRYFLMVTVKGVHRPIAECQFEPTGLQRKRLASRVFSLINLTG